MIPPTPEQREARKYGTDSPHEPTDEFVRRAFAEGAKALWPDSRDPGWIVTFERWLTARVAEFQENALDMARKAHITEIHAEEAEFHVEQLRDALGRAERSAERLEARAVELATERDAALARIARAERLIDSWEHDAPEHSNPVFIGRLRECLRRDPASVRLRGEQCDCAGRLIETNAHEDTCPVEQERWSNSDYVATWEEAHPCAHDWLDRPESDTRECLICGAEVSG